MKNSDRDERLPFLDNFRGIAILMVVAIHALEYSSLAAQTKEVLSYILQTAVPIFFFVDGYLFVNSVRKDTNFCSWAYIRRSAQRLLVPWFIFSVFYLGVRWEFERWDILSQKVVVGEDLLGIVKDLYLSTVSSQMYFLLSLFIIRTLAPLTRHIATHRHRSLVLLVFFVSAWIWISPLIVRGEGFDPFVHALWGFQFYLLGIAAFHYRNSSLRQIATATIFILTCYTLNKTFKLSFGWIDQFSQLLLLYVIVMKAIHGTNWLTNIGRLTMGIYILHMPLVMKAVSVLVALSGSDNAVLNVVLITIGSTLIAAVITKLMMRTKAGRLMLGYAMDNNGSSSYWALSEQAVK